MNRNVIKALLKRSQAQVDFAAGGLECIDMTKDKKYDLIFMDHMMPDPDGIETLHLIKADCENVNQNTTFVVLTANALPGMEENYLKEGFAGYLAKPVMADELEQMLAKYLL